MRSATYRNARESLHLGTCTEDRLAPGETHTAADVPKAQLTLTADDEPFFTRSRQRGCEWGGGRSRRQYGSVVGADVVHLCALVVMSAPGATTTDRSVCVSN